MAYSKLMTMGSFLKNNKVLYLTGCGKIVFLEAFYSLGYAYV
jgi:hypothetical protein